MKTPNKALQRGPSHGDLTRLLHVDVTGCSDCPAYHEVKDDRDHFQSHHCSLGACGFPSDTRGCPEKKPDDGFFATDCPLPNAT